MIEKSIVVTEVTFLETGLKGERFGGLPEQE